MFKKILIANRGEIALRIIQTCKEMGIKTAAVHSTADKDSLHLFHADEYICIGPPSPRESYLNIRQILSVLEFSDAEAVHPGYGFLAENSNFAKLCEDSKIVFIGPSAECIQRMGNKNEAKISMQKAKVLTIPGHDGILSDIKAALHSAEKIGYPVIIKASAGGGGRGMRIAHNANDIENLFPLASAEAMACFKNGDLYLEKYFSNPRHIEIQLIGDKHGNMIYLGERDCTVQRKHQKLIEESPSPVVSPKMRKIIGERAVKGAKSVGYYNAGTMEFIYDNNNFYFMEMNTRIQVEHPVTEMVTGVDLVRQQILVAAGEKLEYSQKDVTIKGHSIECRINAEDPFNDFRPCCGTITDFKLPGGIGVRVDTHCHTGYSVPPYYDSLIAKLIVHAPTRKLAIRRMLRALDEFVVKGIKTTIPLQKRIFHNLKFQSGEFGTMFLEESPELFFPEGK